mmetsp:Transcript_8913/g.28445  ORF Transcript_8913/g.28445 Transcript_8913/m.28445 type:complete len:231 (-) Transcript_8913:161-853(-)
MSVLAQVQASGTAHGVLASGAVVTNLNDNVVLDEVAKRRAEAQHFRVVPRRVARLQLRAGLVRVVVNASIVGKGIRRVVKVLLASRRLLNLLPISARAEVPHVRVGRFVLVGVGRHRQIRDHHILHDHRYFSEHLKFDKEGKPSGRFAAVAKEERLMLRPGSERVQIHRRATNKIVGANAIVIVHINFQRFSIEFAQPSRFIQKFEGELPGRIQILFDDGRPRSAEIIKI